MFQCFISYSQKDTKKVTNIVQLFSSLFAKQVTFWIDKKKLIGGDIIDTEIKKAIENSSLFLLFCSLKSLASIEVKKEYNSAVKENKRIIPIIIDDEVGTKELRTFDEENRIDKKLYVDLSNINNLDQVLQLVKVIRNYYEYHLHGDIFLIEDINDLIDDITLYQTSEIKLFLIDGGTTLSRLFANEKMHEIKDLKIKFLYVDTDFKKFIANTKAAQRNTEVLNIPSDVYSTLYEGLLEASRAIHNRGVHDVDVSNSVDFLRDISLKNNVAFCDIRKTSHMPLFRVIITDKYAYYTHFMLKRWGIERPVQDYFTLRLPSNTEMYNACNEYFNCLFENAMPHTEFNLPIENNK